MKLKHLGFTIVELIVVIAVIAVLATVATIAYRETQKNAQNEKRRVDVAMIRAAVEEYHADNGDYPRLSCASGGGGVDECQRNEVWQMLQSAGYLKNVPKPGTKSYDPVHNANPDGTANYIWLYVSPTRYAIFVPMDPSSESCKTGRNIAPAWWDSMQECDF